MRKFRRKKQPNMDGINLLVSILVCYPEIGTVSFEPKDDTLHFSFPFREVPSKEAFEATGQFIKESIQAYHALEGFFNGQIGMTLEAQGNTAFFHIVRDVYTLSRGEIGLISTLMREHFGKLLILDQERDADMEADAAQGDAIDHMIGNLKINRVTDKMIGVRENGRVMVFNK